MSFSLIRRFTLVPMPQGGPRGEDPRLRVVSWAVVAIRVDFKGPTLARQLNYEVLGTMSGTLQIGATVNDGESVA